MKIPEGMTESQVLSIIETVVNGLAAQYKFGSFEVEDMKQEGRIECIRKIEKFDPNKGFPLEHYFRVIVRNRYINLKRDSYIRRVERCGEHKTYNPNCAQCRKGKASEARNTSKLNVIQPIAIENVDDENEPNTHNDCRLFDMLAREELMHLIDKHLPIGLRADYVRFMQNIKIPKSRENKVKRAITEILQEFYDGEAWQIN